MIPFTSTVSSNLTLVQQAFYTVEPIVFLSSCMFVNGLLIKTYCQTLTQTLKDEVYGKGRTLENLDD